MFPRIELLDFIISTANSDKYLIPPDNITPQSHSKGNDHQLKKLLIVKRILLVNTLGIV